MKCANLADDTTFTLSEGVRSQHSESRSAIQVIAFHSASSRFQNANVSAELISTLVLLKYLLTRTAALSTLYFLRNPLRNLIFSQPFTIRFPPWEAWKDARKIVKSDLRYRFALETRDCSKCPWTPNKLLALQTSFSSSYTVDSSVCVMGAHVGEYFFPWVFPLSTSLIKDKSS